MLDMLKERNKWDQSIEMQAKKGDDFMLKALKAPLDAGKVAKQLVDRYPPNEFGLLVINGVGSAYPLIRTHNLLNNLQPFMGQTPLVVFYPGLYDGQSLKLFGQLGEKPYYRAFRLVS